MNMEVFAGILISFADTVLGAACVFFMRRELNPLVQKILAVSLPV